MIEQKYRDLIDKLIRGTSLKKLTWERTQRETEFKVVLGSSAITTDNWLLENGVDCVDLGILNMSGEVIDRIVYEDNDSERQDYVELLRLYTAAKKSYYKVDETITEIMTHLDF